MRVTYAAVAALVLLSQAPADAARRDPEYSGEFRIRVTDGGYRQLNYDTFEYDILDLTGQEGLIRWAMGYTYNYETQDFRGQVVIVPRVTSASARTSGLAYNFASSGFDAPYQDDGFSSEYAFFEGNRSRGRFGASLNCNDCPEDSITFSYERVNGRYTGRGTGYYSDGFGDENAAIRFEILDGSVVADIPEPATWAMMIAGFGAIGAAARRRRVAVSFA